MSQEIEQITKEFSAFLVEAMKAMDGNKAAGVRARKQSLIVDVMMYEFRRKSLEREREAKK
ncbi:MAG: histone H1 [Bacteroidaceae bacterium]|nr:histone H1 [Bacteroidaceae bacterium]